MKYSKKYRKSEIRTQANVSRAKEALNYAMVTAKFFAVYIDMNTKIK